MEVNYFSAMQIFGYLLTLSIGFLIAKALERRNIKCPKCGEIIK